MAEMSDKQRTRLAQLVTARREVLFVTQSAAYTSAGVAPDTWRFVEQGKRATPRTITRVVRTLWPETGGDWRKVPGIEQWSQEHGSVFMEDTSTERYRLKIEDWMAEIESRLGVVERRLFDQVAPPVQRHLDVPIIPTLDMPHVLAESDESDDER